jgi:hypothetical protein
MKNWASTLWLLSALVLLCGCGGGVSTSGPSSGLSSDPPSGPSSGSSPQGLNVAGNWQFTTSTAGIPPATIAGSIAQSGGLVSGVVHVEGWNCFNSLTPIGLTGALTDSNLSLTSAPVSGQVVTLDGTVANYALTGTYTVKGGCADGDTGSVTGINIPTMANILNGTFTASGGQAFDVSASVAQSSTASPEGSFGITGTATFDGPCFSSGTVTSGAFPSGSFIMGTSVALEIETDNGTVTFPGMLNNDRTQISGDYTVSGGTCDQTGTALLIPSSPWDY